MFSYEFNNGYRPITVKFHGEWKRYHYCKAAYIHRHEHSVSGKYAYDTWLLVSYVTPILVIERMYIVSTGEIIGYNVMWNEDSYRCSSTTIHQLSRFLNELNYRYGVSIHYHVLKEFDKNPIENPIELCGNVYYLKPVSDDEITEYVTNVCSKDSPYFWN